MEKISNFFEEEYQFEENIIFIYFDENNQIQNFTKQIHNRIISHTSLESSLNFIQTIEKQKKIFFITLDSNIPQLLSNIDIFRRVDFIYIFYPKKDQYKYLFHENLNIIGIYHDMDLLCSSIQEQIHLINKENFKWSFFNQEKYLNKDLSKQTNDLLWLHLFHSIITQFTHDEKAKQQID